LVTTMLSLLLLLTDNIGAASLIKDLYSLSINAMRHMSHFFSLLVGLKRKCGFSTLEILEVVYFMETPCHQWQNPTVPIFHTFDYYMND